MKNANKNRRGKVAAIFLALLVTATAVPAMSISALAAENNNTTVQPQDGGVDTHNTTTSGSPPSFYGEYAGYNYRVNLCL